MAGRMRLRVCLRPWLGRQQIVARKTAARIPGAAGGCHVRRTGPRLPKGARAIIMFSNNSSDPSRPTSFHRPTHPLLQTDSHAPTSLQKHHHQQPSRCRCKTEPSSNFRSSTKRYGAISYLSHFCCLSARPARLRKTLLHGYQISLACICMILYRSGGLIYPCAS